MSFPPVGFSAGCVSLFVQTDFLKLSLAKGADICHSETLGMTDSPQGERPWLMFCKRIRMHSDSSVHHGQRCLSHTTQWRFQGLQANGTTCFCLLPLLLPLPTKQSPSARVPPFPVLDFVRCPANQTQQAMEACDEMLDGSQSLVLVRPLRHLSSAVATSPLSRGRERKQASRLLKGKSVELN